MSYHTYAEQYPPILVRLLARHRNGAPLTTAEISARVAQQGWPMSAYLIGNISASLDWDDIPFGAMRAFLAACEMDFTDRAAMQRKRVYMKMTVKTAKFTYLQKSPEWESVLRPLAIRYRAYIAERIKAK
jgi:hypothetical protein